MSAAPTLIASPPARLHHSLTSFSRFCLCGGVPVVPSRGNFIPDAQEQDCIDRFIADNLTADLEVLKVKELNQALHEFVEKDEAKAVAR